MRVETKYLGHINIDKSQIITFKKGLPGFENHRDFILVAVEENEHFKFLQNIHNPYISFLIVNPWDFYSDYHIELSNEDLYSLGIYKDSMDQLAVYNIVTMGDSLEDATCNLLAPIVINVETREARQFILNGLPYSTRHSLIYKDDNNASYK